jgi:hypothetical protein
MTAKDYRAIAAALRADRAWQDGDSYSGMDAWTRGAYDQWHTAVLAVARVLAADNPRFDADRFYSAAGFRGGAT